MADKEKNEASFGKKFKTILLTLFASLILAFVLSYIAACGLAGLNPADIQGTINNQQFKTIFMVIAMIAGVVTLMIISNHKFKFDDSNGAKVKTKGGIKKFYDTNWLTLEELKKNPAFKFHFYEDLHRSDNLGIPIRAELVGNKLQVNMYKSIHTLVVGTTGAGKTTQFVDPTMQILSESHAKPCLVVTDPKGEIHSFHSEKLKKNGYRVLVFDLKEPFQSTRWNPLTRAYELNERSMNLNKEVKVHHNDDPRDLGLKCVSQVYYGEWYEFDGFAFVF